jgi:hypothetical protein
MIMGEAREGRKEKSFEAKNCVNNVVEHGKESFF